MSVGVGSENFQMCISNLTSYFGFKEDGISSRIADVTCRQN
jgi:hypothetical protein